MLSQIICAFIGHIHGPTVWVCGLPINTCTRCNSTHTSTYFLGVEQ